MARGRDRCCLGSAVGDGFDGHRTAEQAVMPFGAPEHLRVALPSDLCGELVRGEHGGVFLGFPTSS
jgi:hypothetical protein